MEYDFGHTKIDFKLTKEDLEHAINHKTKMLSWERPLSNSAYIDDKVFQNFPFYSLRCQECDYKGQDYTKEGIKR